MGYNTNISELHSLRSGGDTQATNNNVSDILFNARAHCRSKNANDCYAQDSLTAKLLVSKNLGL